MRLTQVLSKQHFGRWYNDLWKQSKNVSINDHKLRELLEAQGKIVHDAAKLFGIQADPKVKSVGAKVNQVEPEPLLDPIPAPPCHERSAYLYQGSNLLLGLRQAQAITNTIQVGEGLPERLNASQELDRLGSNHEMVTDIIRTSLMLDATQEKLGKVIDIQRLGLQQPREYGIPPSRSNRSLLSGLLSLCERMAGRAGIQSRAVLYKPLLQAINTTTDGHRLLLSRRPEVTVLADAPLPAEADPAAVKATRLTAPPPLAPVSPYVHLHREHNYQWHDVAPVSTACRHRHVHTLMVSWNRRLKKFVDDDQLGALSLMCMYAAALNMSRQQTEAAPVTLQCVATDGQLFKLSVLQLNTPAMPEPGSGDPAEGLVKNQLWTEPATALYESCGYRDGHARLDGYDGRLVSRLLAMYTHGLVPATV